MSAAYPADPGRTEPARVRTSGISMDGRRVLRSSKDLCVRSASSACRRTHSRAVGFAALVTGCCTVAEFVFFTGPMDCGKSTLALQLDHTYRATGRLGRRFTCRDRAGAATISSRLGLQQPAIEITDALDLWEYVTGELTGGARIDYLICDEAQFYSADQVDQLARIVDELQLDVYAFGILTDFRTKIFTGSQRLVELCDRVDPLQVRALCWCGERATHNARTVDGRMVTEGAQVVVDDPRAGSTAGDVSYEVVSYEVLCRRHHRRRITRAVAQATWAEPLPFDRPT